MRAGDTVARFGGDEFTILLERLASPEAAGDAARRVLELLETPLSLLDRTVTVSASIGIATAEGGHSAPDELTAQADMAMYAAKSSGAGKFEFFNREMRRESRRRLELGQELSRAIDERELVVHYQPILELSTMRMTGVEALVRWARPGHGLVPPGDFIPIAEASGLIDRLGLQVLGSACREVLTWQSTSPGAVGLELSVNVSARQFQAGFAASVGEVLHATGFDPDRLTLEITESAVLDDAVAAEESISDLRSMGVRFVVDDFGTGYSALGYFKRFGISGLKLDRSFVRGLGRGAEDTAIVAATLAFAHALGLRVTAEGIEDSHQLAWLREAGCELGQGYFFARPMSAQALGGLMIEMASSGR
jgi:predicted signal transduction protein with EAL and GGDEF domain